MKAIQTVTEKQEQLNGMALGGIGTGSVEIKQTGRLEDWEIFNLGQWASVNPEQNHKENLPEYDYDVLPFYVRTKKEGQDPVLRKLSHDSKLQGFRSLMYSFMKNVETIRWTPDFPICHMEYEDSELPIELRAEFFSPFIPHDTKNSGMPGFYVNFEAKNPSEEAVEVSLMGCLKNPVNRGLAERKRKNSICKTNDRITLLMASESEEKAEQNGSIALSVTGGEASYIKGDFEAFFGAYVMGGDFGIAEESYMFGFRECGELPNFGWESIDEKLLALDEEKIRKMDEAQVDEMLESVKMLPSGYRPWKRLKEVRPDILETVDGKRKFVANVLRHYQIFETITEKSFGSGALCSRIVLQPGETKNVRFLVTWNFPNHISTKNSYVGHRYSCWHKNAEETAAYLTEHAEEIQKKVRLFSETVQNCSAPAELVRNWVIQLSTMVKCSWWSEDGRFGMWEGLGSCGFHTIDVSYYGTFMILSLFPELQLKQMKMAVGFQREDGRIHHCFNPDFDHVDNGYDRVDINPQFVLMVYRDYMWTGDREYLEYVWEIVRKAMAITEELDGDGDGLLDHGTEANTYDAWKFRGTPTYIAGLWLAALSAGVRLAREIGDENSEKHWQQIYHTGKENFKKLWNGEYFSLWADREERDECLMSGQLDPVWYCRMLGLPSYVEDEHTKKVLDMVWKYNYTKEGGLINASYPEGKTPTLYTYDNVQVQSNWSGMEYILADMFMEMGYFEKAVEIAGNVEKRHMQAGRIFNHEECGNHYYRPMSAWTLLLSLGGLRYEKNRKAVTLNPKQEELTVPWFTTQGYGILEVRKDSVLIRCLEGSLEYKTIRLWGERKAEQILASGEVQEFEQKGLEIAIQTGGILDSGDELLIVSSCSPSVL